ncbi:hypothetical protein [Nakamurella lactea]|uniref:hypothetical protein n=1 Tax=Nakamurella lactea TaxID=459515 RepID=UPI00048FB896|nr:hypothetical protein [Nakamurella lactea]
MGERSEVRLPPQGGLPPVDVGTGEVVEIACDESGFSGRNLLDPSIPVITHASVDLRVDEAAELIAAVRSALRSAPGELKSRQLLRGRRADQVLAMLLTALSGRAHVHVVEKEYYLVTRIVDLFMAEPTYASGTRLTQQQRPAALALYRARGSAGPDWNTFLATFVELVRTKRRREPDRRALDRFFQARDALLAGGIGPPAAGVLEELLPGRVLAVVSRMTHDDRSIPPPLEPVLPALAETVMFWSAGHRSVVVIHDEQSALTPDRLTRLKQVLAESRGPAAGTEPGRPTRPAMSPLAGLVTVDSRDDPRVQVADLLAGVARHAEESGDDGPLQPFVSPTSLRDRARSG